jgi:beta-glucosidase
MSSSPRVLTRLLPVLLAILAAGHGVAARQSPGLEARIDQLLAAMTLEEKLGQLQQLAGGAEGTYDEAQAGLAAKGLLGSMLNVRGAARTNALQRLALERSRLKIPLLFGFDVIHGYRTVFPIPLGEAASWDPAAAERSSAIAAAEASAVGVKWTFAPMVDIARDPRWGRVAEGAGEDTHLGAAFARARVRGFQGADPSAADRVLACMKHYVGYGAAEGGRDYNATWIPDRLLREVYLPPFKAGLDAGAGTVMSAFNDLNGVPTSANPYTLTTILQREWAFDGFVVSDYESVRELVHHGIAADTAEAAQKALMSGVDMEMVSRTYNEHGAALLQKGRITQARIDDAVRRILRVKMRLGLFDRPYADESREAAVLLAPAHRAAAREIAARSMVLLRNQGGVLPLATSVRSIALVGPLGDSQADMLGSWAGDGRAADVVTLRAGLQAAAPSARITVVKGCDVSGPAPARFDAAVRAARAADVTVLAIGEAGDMSGEAASRSSLDLPGAQLDLVKAVVATGKPVVAVLFNGRPLSIPWVLAHVPAVVEAWFPGTEAGNAIADVLFGAANPGGKLPMTFPRTVGQVPIYYNHANTGRPAGEAKYTSKYIDLPSDPLLPFGFGLSYTTFALKDFTVAPFDPSRGIEATVTVTNTGQRAGDEVVQIYVRDVAGSATRPIRQLVGFSRVTLDPGASRTLTFTIQPSALAVRQDDGSSAVEPGTFTVWAATSSVGGLETTFDVR